MTPGSKKPMAAKLAKYAVTLGGCWEWQGARDKDGYGRIRGTEHGRSYMIRAHRASFEHHVRSLRPGEHVCHTCDNPPCVNPAHLYAGDAACNGRDKALRGRARTTPQPGRQNGMYGRSGPLNPFHGRHHTEATRQRLRELALARAAQ